MSRFLSDITAVEVAGGRAAALCGKLLADCGARTVKVLDRGSLLDVYADSAKTTVGFDLSTPEGRELVREVASSAAVFVTDLTVARLEELGFAPLATDAARNGLVHVHMTPFGTTGARGSWHGDELTAQALSGGMSMVGDPERPPLVLPFGIAEFQHALSAAGAVVAALLNRQRTGEGACVDVALADVMATYMRQYGMVYGYYDVPLKRAGRRAPGSGGRYPMSIFPCKDGYVALIARTRRDWARFVEMMGSPAWAEEPRYQDLYAMAMEYPDEVDELVTPWLVERTRAELTDLAREYGIPMGVLQNVDELVDDPQLEYRDFFEAVSVGDQAVHVPGRPWKTDRDDSPDSRRLAMTGLEESTRRFLAASLGYDEARLESLAATGAITGPGG